MLHGEMSKRILGAGIVATGIVVLSVGLIFGIGFPKVVYQSNLKNVCIEDDTHPLYQLWVGKTRLPIKPEECLYQG